MEYTELADYALPTGRLTEWVPRVQPDHWRPDARALSPNHASHLAHTATRSDGERSAWIGTAFGLSGAFDASAFAATMQTWIARHDAFRTTARSLDGQFHRVTVDATDVVVTPGAGIHSPTTSGSHRLLESFFDRAISATHWPHVVAATIEPAAPADRARGVIVVVAADHSVMDAYTQLLLIHEFREIYRTHRDGGALQLPPCGSYIDHCAAEAAVAAGLTADDPALDAWTSFWQNDSGLGCSALAGSNPGAADRHDSRPAMPGFPLPLGIGTHSLPTESGTRHQSSVSRWLLSATDTAAFAAATKRHGKSMSSGAFTALAIAIARLTGRRDLRFVMPMHTRTDPASLAAAGWYVGLVPVRLDLGSAPTFGAALDAVDADVRRDVALTHLPYPRMAELGGMMQAPRFAVSFVDTRHLPGATAWDDRDRALRSPSPDADEVYLWVNRTAAGLNVSLRFPNNEVAAASLHAVLAEFGTVLREVATVGDVAVTTEPAVSGARTGGA